MIDQPKNERINSQLRALYQQHSEAFLDLWQASETGAAPRPARLNEFGIIDPQRYDAERGVLFVGRELNGWKDEDLRSGCTFLRWMQQITKEGRFPKGARPNMWYNIGRWAMLIDAPESSIAHLAECKAEALAQIGTIAFTNVNKVWGSSRASGAFFTLAEKELVLQLLRQEIEIIQPEVIVCCGTGHQVRQAAADYGGRMLAMPHPGARTSKTDLLAQLLRQLSQ